jgi:hypothetical protein
VLKQLCKDHTFKRTSSELQNLFHTNELMGKHRDTIFAMVCTPSRTRGLLFLQAHRETDRFFEASGVQSAESTSGFFHFHRAAFSGLLKSRVGNIIAKASALRVNLRSLL